LFHVNLIHPPLPELDVGAEASGGERTLEGDREGNPRRIHTTVN